MTDLRRHSGDYLDLRRALGYKLAGEGRLLADFVAFLDKAGASTVTTALAAAWTTQASGSAAYIARRMRVARHFARYLHALDPDTEVPPDGLFPAGKHRPVPYIFSADDVEALMAAARTLEPASQGGDLRDPDRAVGSDGHAGGRSHGSRCRRHRLAGPGACGAGIEVWQVP